MVNIIKRAPLRHIKKYFLDYMNYAPDRVKNNKQTRWEN